jgi:hypothetical protein
VTKLPFGDCAQHRWPPPKFFEVLIFKHAEDECSTPSLYATQQVKVPQWSGRHLRASEPQPSIAISLDGDDGFLDGTRIAATSSPGTLRHSTRSRGLIPATAGATVAVAKGVQHAWANLSETDIRLLGCSHREALTVFSRSLRGAGRRGRGPCGYLWMLDRRSSRPQPDRSRSCLAM